jgi:hypothetical protein
MIGEEYNELIIATKQWFSKSAVNIISGSDISLIVMLDPEIIL